MEIDFTKNVPATGSVTSPNYPNNYPNRLKKTEMIQVEQGLILSLQFTAFNIKIEWDSTCDDHLTITDGDGTTLMEKSCGYRDYEVVIGGESIGSSLPPAIRSRTNTINLVFITDDGGTYSGWSVSWRAVAGINHQPS